MTSKAKLIISTLCLLSIIAILTKLISTPNKSTKIETAQDITSPTTGRVWQFRSIDTMKVSRDQAKKSLSDPDFYSTINEQLKDIKDSGANYVAIGTPYDGEFLPTLRLWVKGARENHLHVWFRGNFSGWEGWFGYSRNLTRDDHIKQTANFIAKNPDFFENGDIFTACPECENGGPGDPRQGDIDGFRRFMIDERGAAKNVFDKIDKKVYTNFNSMNLDVAKIVYDDKTLKEMDNLIVVDHYVNSPSDFIDHISELARTTLAQVMLGEIGAPVSGIHDKMNEDQQAEWLNNVLSGVSKNKMVVGANWWVNLGGETAIFNSVGSPRKAAAVLEKYYNTQDLTKF